MITRHVAEFKSSSFPKYENEDDRIVNPGCWGERLAEYLRDKLPLYGLPTGDILAEDWGWLVYVQNPDFTLWIGCGAQIDREDPSTIEEALFFKEGEIHQFVIFIAAEPNLIQRLLKKVDVNPAIENTVQSLRLMIEDNIEVFLEPDWS